MLSHRRAFGLKLALSRRLAAGPGSGLATATPRLKLARGRRLAVGPGSCSPTAIPWTQAQDRQQPHQGLKLRLGYRHTTG